MSEVIVGIDLGTTNSLVAVCENGQPRVLPAEDGNAIVPSVVHWADGKSAPVVGRAARRLRITDAGHTAYSVKRFIGRGKKDLDSSVLSSVNTAESTEENVVIKLGQRSFSAIELSAEILKRLKAVAEYALEQPVKKAVVTVPAYFNDSQRSATKLAGTLAGLDVVRIVNEPTAAALAYGLAQKQNGLIAVYDLGGGTFDISILKLHDGIFEVLSTGGDTVLGGDDFDMAIAQELAKQLGEQWKRRDVSSEASQGTDSAAAPDLNDVELKARLLDAAEKIKIQLSFQETAAETVSWGSRHIRLLMTREDFERAIAPLVEKTLDITRRALEDAHLTTEQIDDIVLVGGSTRVPLVRSRLRELFDKDINLTMNPDEVVALGAAIQADILSGKNESMVLLDVVPLSLGIETYGGTVGKLIHRNSKIPAVAMETFTTHVDGQKNVLIHVVQGERELAADCRSLARFNLKGLPPLPAGAPKIQVTFLVDANGILTVKAREMATGTEATVEVKPSYGLSDQQVEKMLSDSFDFAETDMKSRLLIDARVEAEGVIRSAEKILQDAGELASPEEAAKIREHMKDVKSLMAADDHLAIRDGLDRLEDVAKPLAERVMNAAIKKSLQSKRVEDVLKK